jgi:peroxiredoxin
MTLHVGDVAPKFSLRAIDGQTYSLNHELTLAIFFKTSCPTCQLAWRYYERLHRAYQANGLHLWGISQHNREKTQKYAAKYGATFPHLIDDNLKVSREYDPEFVPTGFLIDADGKIVETFTSWNRARLNQLSEQIASRLNVSPQEMIQPEENVVAFKPG